MDDKRYKEIAPGYYEVVRDKEDKKELEETRKRLLKEGVVEYEEHENPLIEFFFKLRKKRTSFFHNKEG